MAREILDTELTAMAAESYQRAYGAMVSVQMLAELEEVIQYKLKPEKRQIIYKVWWDRLQVLNYIDKIKLNYSLNINYELLSCTRDVKEWLKIGNV